MTKRDSAGFFTTSPTTLATNSYAITSDTLDVGSAARVFGDGFGTVQISVTSDRPVFLGIARTSDLERYLGDVDHQAVTDVNFDPFTVTYADRPGTVAPGSPAGQTFWRVHADGTGTQTIRWPIEKGHWTAVAMNADGSRHVIVDTTVGARVPALRWVILGTLVGGAVLLAIGGGLVWAAVGRSSAPRE